MVIVIVVEEGAVVLVVVVVVVVVVRSYCEIVNKVVVVSSNFSRDKEF